MSSILEIPIFTCIDHDAKNSIYLRWLNRVSAITTRKTGFLQQQRGPSCLSTRLSGRVLQSTGTKSCTAKNVSRVLPRIPTVVLSA